MKKHPLNGQWLMEGNGYLVNGNIPGSVYSVLYMDNGLLPDPYFRDNEKIYLELAEHEYTFKRTFAFTPTNHPVLLVCEGLDTLCSVYINGALVADTDNMHVRYEFDVTKLLTAGENTIAIVCHPVNPFIKEKAKTVTTFASFDCMQGSSVLRKASCMMGWDWGPRLPDAGIWKDIYLLEKDSARLTDVELLQRHENGKVFVLPKVETDSPAEIAVTVTDPNGKSFTLPANQESEIENALLWWPNGMGKQNLYTFLIEVKEGANTVDYKSLRLGLRTMRLVREEDEIGRSFYHEINGVPMFAKGADYVPEDNILSRITKERTRELLTNCIDCNFNALRVWGGGFYPHDFFFDLCDELGIVVFFDLMFACAMYDFDQKALDGIATEVTQNLQRLRHHASIGLIAGNNEIEWHLPEYIAMCGVTNPDYYKQLYLHLFEELIPNIINKVAPYITYVPSSPSSNGGLSNPNDPAMGDCHDWLTNAITCRGQKFRYVSEFGVPAAPSLKTIKQFTIEEDRNAYSKIMTVHLRHRGFIAEEAGEISKNFLMPTSFEYYVYASQVRQAEEIQSKVEHFRRLHGCCMGVLYWQLNDIWPVTSWSSIDYYGRYKALQYYAKRFYAPVLVSCLDVGEKETRPHLHTEEGTYSKEKSATLCVTNDTFADLNCEVVWELRDNASNIVKSGSVRVFAPKQTATWLDKLDFSDVDPENIHLAYRVVADGKTLSSGSVVFTPFKFYNFINPELRCEINGDTITVKSNAYAKAVEIDFKDSDVILEDNFFDMEKGERTIKILKGTPTEVTLRSVYGIR